MPTPSRKRQNEDFFARLLRRRPQNREYYEKLLSGDGLEGREGPDRQTVLETIVDRERPVLFVKDGRVDTEDAAILGPEARDLVGNLGAARTRIEPLLPLVGRIDVSNFPNGLAFVGTGWFIAENIVVTNRHVAELIARWDGHRYVFIPGVRGLSMQPTLNLRHEYDDVERSDDPRFPVVEVLYIEPPSGTHDIAFLRVVRGTDGGQPPHIEIADRDLDPDREVCVIGHPARAPARVIPDQALMHELYRDRYDIKRIAPGFSMRPEGSTARHDCTTLGGNSGSVLIDTATGKAAGLHFAGLYKEANYAVPASVLKDYVARRRWTTPPAIETGRLPQPLGSTVSATMQAPADAGAAASASVTVPLTITVSLNSPPSSRAATTIPTDAASDPAVVEAAARAFWRARPPGVVGVRVGYDEDQGRIGDRPSIVASVLLRELAVLAGTPASVLGIPVRYESASLLEQIEARPLAEAVTSVAYDDEAREGPRFSFDPVEESMTVRAHVGPEYSWAELRSFLGAARARLVSGIYEFRGPHIRDALQDRLSDGVALTLVMDNSTFARVRDADVEFEARDAFEEWEDRFGTRFRRMVPPEGSSGLIANAYHIKVAVREDDTFWLSSGNWKLTSSQPIITQDQLDAAETEDLPGNREWHMIVNSPTLAARLRNHLEQDFVRSDELGGGPLPRSMMDEAVVEVSAASEAAVLERPPPSRILAPLVVQGRRVSARYLLTPDHEGAVYGDAVLALIRSARSSLLFQIPYIGMPAFPGQDRGYIDDLIAAVTKKLKTLRDARVLLRQGGRDLSDPRHAAWYFKSQGVDIDARLRVIADHHTKGMIVDGQRVLVGSHNWSAAGVTLNRDASIIFDDREIAGYFAEAFEIDWARSSTVSPRKSPRAEGALVERPEAGPAAGAHRISLSDYLDD